MTTDKTIRIRMATALDAVNLYQLLVAEEEKSNIGLAFDETARLVHIINVIATGYVLVAEKSGRIVGSAGFANGAPGYASESILVSDWMYLLPSLRNTDLGKRLIKKLLDKLTKFADLKAVQTRLYIPTGSKLSAALEAQGFTAAAVMYVREPGMTDGATAEPADGDAAPSVPDGSVEVVPPATSAAAGDCPILRSPAL